MLENHLQPKRPAQEGIIISDPDGLVIAWRDGIARRFSWDQLRQLSLNLTIEISGQSANPEPARVQPVAYYP